MADLIQLDIDDAPLRALFQRLATKTADASEAMAEVAQIMMRHTEAAFEAEGSPDKWVDLSPVTKALRTEDGTWPGKILQITNQLAASVVPASGPDFAQVGSNKVYAALQQLGGKAGRNRKVTVPARPYLPITVDRQLTPGAQVDILEFLQGYLSDALG